VTFKTETAYQVRWAESYWAITFTAMAGPCEILVRCKNRSEAEHLASLAFTETRRIERKFSRYRDDNVIHTINHSKGAPIEADEELARLLDGAEQCYRLSGGLFDITSGVLRRAWKFNGAPFIPDTKLIASLLELVGWDRVSWDGRSLRLEPGMEIDLGGIGKEYAVDRVAEMLFQDSGAAMMVNFGGDIRALTNEKEPTSWIVGIEDPARENSPVGQINITSGGVATSGDSRRFCTVNGVRMGHILNPRTGWPVKGAPHSITALGSYCFEAGFLATYAMLQGTEAEKFLTEQGVTCYCIK
jgi:thiamine biosynthesis lipoprotein